MITMQILRNIFNNRRNIFVVLLGFAASFFLAPQVFAEYIRSFDDTIAIQEDGTFSVNESILYDFTDMYRHGIYRIIPAVKTNAEGKKFVLGYSNISITDLEKVPYTYSTTKTEEHVSLKIGDADKTITGIRPYVIQYRVEGGLTYFSDHDELYWNVTGNDWEVPIKKISVDVVFPESVNPKDVTISCYTGALGVSAAFCTTSYKNSVARVTTTKQLESGEGLTIAVTFPKNIVAVLEPVPFIPFWETLLGKILIGIISIAALLWYVVFPISIPVFWWRHGRDPKPSVGVASAWFDAPKTKSGRSLTPGETGTLVDEKADMPDITATLVDLARRGYLRILEPKKGEFSLEKITGSVKGQYLESHEKTLMTGIFSSSDLIGLKTASLVDTVEKAKNNLYDAVVAEGFFLKNPNTIRTIYTVVAMLGLFSGNIGLFLSALIFGRNMPAKTVQGASAAAVGKSLKNFLTSQERSLTFQAKNQMFFEKLLPYAIAFGVEKIWAERFKGITMKPPDWYSGYSSTHFNSLYLVHALGSTGSSFSRAATPVSSSSGFSSGGGGGGFSGGGGGGGGGGSW